MTLSTTSPGDEREAVHAAIRAAGGIVHGDGNIFFTNYKQFLSSSTVQQVGAEPSQSGSAGEAEGFEAWAQTILGDNPTWRESGDGELARQAWNAALSRQAPAAPAEVAIFNKQRLAEYVAEFAPTPAEPAQALLGWTRYEKARKLNVAQWAELHQRNLKGENFDDMIDALPATTQPVQQDTDEPDPWALRFKRALLAIKYNAVSLADAQVIALRALNGFDDSPPAEKQAAPSGEGEA